MKVAVTDANIFIDLINLKLVSHFFDLNLETHTTLDVLNELHSHQQEVILAYRSAKKLTIHNLPDDQRTEMQELVNARQLSDADKSVIYIALQIKAMVLSSDGPVRKFAKAKKLETHGLLWLFDELVKNKLLSHPVACSKINELLSGNRRYREDLVLSGEFDQRLKDWGKLI
jgi:rRNA maturation endonuclease Nob1